MNVKRFFSSPIHPVQMTLFILIELLLIFDRDFAKFHLFSFFHLYDFLLLLTGVTAFIILLVKRRFSFHWPILALLGISVAYLAYSVIFNIGPLNYIVRHYALFMYLALFYVIYQSYIDKTAHQFNIRFMLLIAAMALLFQLGYFAYKAFFTNNFSLLGEFNYYSPMAVVGLIMCSSYTLSFPAGWKKKILLYALSLLLLIPLGHASAFLAGFVMFFVYLGLQFKPAFKLQVLISFVLLLVAFRVFVPAFSDTNSSWRIKYWAFILDKHFTEQYGLLGSGFGVPYANDELTQLMIDDLKQTTFDYQPEERYLSPPHNSFLTILFHIGFLPMLLLFLPLKKPLAYLVARHDADRPPVKDFLLLAFVGLTAWASFNVVLELPHNSAFYWLVFFSLIYEFDRKEKAVSG